MRPPSKKQQIASLYQLGIHKVGELASLTGASPSYIASVLREARLLGGYYDLYTSSRWPMNVYSKYFAGKLGFKDIGTARRSAEYLDAMYQQFARTEDRAGQHHALYLALTMFNRARWSGKKRPAEVYAAWLIQRLTEDESLSLPAAEMEHLLALSEQKSKENG